MTGDRKDTIDTVMDVFDAARDFYDENQEVFDEVMGRKGSVSLQNMEPLKQIIKEDDMVEVTIETKADSIIELGFEYLPQKHTLVMKSNDGPVSIVLPDDAVVDEIDAEMHNGVVSVKVPRQTESETINITEEIDDEGDN